MEEDDSSFHVQGVVFHYCLLFSDITLFQMTVLIDHKHITMSPRCDTTNMLNFTSLVGFTTANATTKPPE
jgi:hypothetical protein